MGGGGGGGCGVYGCGSGVEGWLLRDWLGWWMESFGGGVERYGCFEVEYGDVDFGGEIDNCVVVVVNDK